MADMADRLEQFVQAIPSKSPPPSQPRRLPSKPTRPPVNLKEDLEMPMTTVTDDVNEEPPPQFDTDELKQMYKDVRDIKNNQQNVENHIRKLFDHKKYDSDEFLLLKKKAIVYLNNFIQETCNISSKYDNKKYLYRLKYVIEQKGKKTYIKIQDLRKNDLFDDGNNLLEIVDTQQELFNEDKLKGYKLQKLKANVKAEKQSIQISEQKIDNNNEEEAQLETPSNILIKVQGKLDNIKQKLETIKTFMVYDAITKLNKIKDIQQECNKDLSDILKSKDKYSNREIENIYEQAKENNNQIQNIAKKLLEYDVTNVSNYIDALYITKALLDILTKNNLNTNFTKDDLIKAKEIAKKSIDILSKINIIFTKSTKLSPKNGKYIKELNTYRTQAIEINNIIQKKYIQLNTTSGGKQEVNFDKVLEYLQKLNNIVDLHNKKEVNVKKFEDTMSIIDLINYKDADAVADAVADTVAVDKNILKNDDIKANLDIIQKVIDFILIVTYNTFKLNIESDLINQIDNNNKSALDSFKSDIKITTLSDITYDNIKKIKNIAEYYYNDINEILRKIYNDKGVSKKIYEHYKIIVDKIKLIRNRIETVNTTLHDKLKDIQYRSLFVTEYSSEKIKVFSNEPSIYVPSFMHHVHTNNQIDFESEDYDPTLKSITYPLAKFFENFNKKNAFEYASIKSFFEKHNGEYQSNIQKYKDALIQLLSNFEQDMQKINITMSTENAWYMLKTYLAFIIAILALVGLFASYLTTVIRFFNSVYSKNVSLHPSIIDDSMYAGYNTVYGQTIGGWVYFYDIKTSSHLGIYALLFFLIILPNLINLGGILRGQASVVKTFWFDYNAFPYIHANTHIFDKIAEPLMYYGVILMIIIIMINILYYAILLTQSDVFQKRYDNHKTIQSLYDHINIDLLEYLFRSDIKDLNGNIITNMKDKLKSWMYIGESKEHLKKGSSLKYVYPAYDKTKDASDNYNQNVLKAWRDRIGDNEDRKDMLKKRYSIFVTYIFAKEYVNSKYKRAIFDTNEKLILTNDTNNNPSLFLYQHKDDNNTFILPLDSDTNFTKYVKENSNEYIIHIIKGPPDDDTKTIMNNIFNLNINKVKQVGDYSLDAVYNNQEPNKEHHKELLKTYNELATSLKDANKQMKSTDSAIMHRVDVIYSFIFAIIFALCIMQIILWMFTSNQDIYEVFIMRNFSRIRAFMQIVVLIIILIVVL